MENKYYVENPKELILEFLNSQFPECEKLDEQLNKLQLFSFWDIKEKEKYRNNKYRIDGDCTNLTYAIGWCLWGEKLKDCYGDKKYSFKDLLNEKDFSGDTICTWNTLFNDPRILIEINFSAKEKNEILDFYRLCQSIGNFYLLPNRKYGRNTLNTYRGNYYGLKDYFDLFREHLKNHDDSSIENLINKNSFFFGDSSNSWGKLRDTFYLKAVENLNFKKEHYNHSQYRKENRDVYKEFVLDYIRQSIEMINERSMVIIEKLKNFFKTKNN